MEEYFTRLSQDALAATPSAFVRPLYDNITWEAASIALLGTRGVGKTTLLLQRMRALGLPPREALYIDLGDLYFQQNRLFEFAQRFRSQGGRYLFIDEVHRYGFAGEWAQEIKQLYDLYRSDLHIAFTGSSAVRILDQRADLSRRVLQFRVPGLSFREYLRLYHDLSFAPVSLTDLLHDSVSVVHHLVRERGLRPLAYFTDYLQHGYYPYGLELREGYLRRVNETIQLVLESDLPAVVERGEVGYTKIGRLLYAVASSAPFKPNVSKLAERLALSRETVLRYLQLLQRADILINLRAAGKGISTLSKPDKIYLNNTNLLYALAPTEVSIGTVRETFLANQLDVLTHERHVAATEVRLPKRGDFLLRHRTGDYLLEVGGPEKDRRQIGAAPNHYAVMDAESTEVGERVPLWVFGMMY